MKIASPNLWASFIRLLREEWKTVIVVTLANVLLAFAVVNFTLPYHFPDLGVSGLAVLSHYVFGISPSWLIFIGNMILLVWGWKNLQPRFLLLTIYSVTVFSIFMPLMEYFPLPFLDDKFMATVITGLLKGFSIGIMFNVGASSGGVDIIAMVVRRRYGMEVGQFSIFINIFILGLSLFVVNFAAVVYGVVGLYVFGLALDSVTRRFDKRKQAFIITNMPDEACSFITSKGKGVTRIEGRGAYTGEPRPILVSLLEPRQVIQLKKFLQEKDPNAFVSICDATEVLGKGFKSWTSL